MNTQADTIKSAIEMCLKVLKTYEWLLDLYVLDFFVDNHWAKLPSLWCQTLASIDPKDLGNILSGNTTKHILPLSLLALFKTINALSIPRQGCSYNIKNQTSRKYSCDHPKLKNLFLKHVKLKKRHEISMMSEFVHLNANKSKCNAVVDFGSGLGHLLRILSYKYNLQAAGIEMQTQLTEEARKLDAELEYTAKKHLTQEQMTSLLRPTHCNTTLSSVDQLRDLLISANMTNYGLIGLHPCGDLGPLLIKHFVRCDEVKFICVVGCCYMKLSCDEEPCSYPMSEYVKSLDSRLSYTSREIACHAIDTYCERLCKGEYKDLKVHTYRAALEKLLVNLDPSLKHMPVRNVKHTNDMSFSSYCSAALNQISLKPRKRDSVKFLHSDSVKHPNSDSENTLGSESVKRLVNDSLKFLDSDFVKHLDSDSLLEDLAQWKRVVILYTLRLSLAPLVETVILLDRMLYMLENGISCAIYPVFDPKISPRNHIIVGRKS